LPQWGIVKQAGSEKETATIRYEFNLDKLCHLGKQ